MREGAKASLTVHCQLIFAKPLSVSDDEYEEETNIFLDTLREEVDKIVAAFLESAVGVHPTLVASIETSTTLDLFS